MEKKKYTVKKVIRPPNNFKLCPPMEMKDDLKEIGKYFRIIRNKKFLRRFRTLGWNKFKTYINIFYLNNSKDIENRELFLMMFNNFIDKWYQKWTNKETDIFLNYKGKNVNDIRKYLSTLKFKENYKSEYFEKKGIKRNVNKNGLILT